MRMPTKIGSLETLMSHGLNPSTIFDVGAGRTGTLALFRNFADKKNVMIEPITEYESTIKKAAKKHGANNYELIAKKAYSSVAASDYTTLDEIADNGKYEPSYLKKIDVDGEDLEVAKGATTLFPQTDCIIVESIPPWKLWFYKDHDKITETITPVEQDRDAFSFMHFFNKHDFILYDIVDMLYDENSLTGVDLVFISKRFLSSSTLLRHDPAKRCFTRLINENGVVTKEFHDYLQDKKPSSTTTQETFLNSQKKKEVK